MARLNDVERAALGNWWDLAIGAAGGGFTSTDLVSAASSLATEAGRSLAFGEATSLAILYGYARRMVNAAAELGAAPDQAVIGPEMVAVPPWARDEQVMATTPVWHVPFEMTFIGKDGNVQTQMRTSVFEETMPDTVGGLTSAVTEDAQAMADKYGIQLVSIRLINILAV